MSNKSKVVFAFVKETANFNVFEAPAGENLFGKIYAPKLPNVARPTSLTVTIAANA